MGKSDIAGRRKDGAAERWAVPCKDIMEDGRPLDTSCRCIRPNRGGIRSAMGKSWIEAQEGSRAPRKTLSRFNALSTKGQLANICVGKSRLTRDS